MTACPFHSSLRVRDLVFLMLSIRTFVYPMRGSSDMFIRIFGKGMLSTFAGHTIRELITLAYSTEHADPDSGLKQGLLCEPQ